YMGDVTGGLASKRARINGTDSLRGGVLVIRAQAPLAEVVDYQTELRSLTGGEGRFAMELSHYDAVPAQIQKQLTEAYRHKPGRRAVMTLASLWLPIILSAVFVFIASALINMLLKFWHAPDYRQFSNEGEVRAAIRAGTPAPGQYSIPWCGPGAMKDPAMQEKFIQGPVGLVNLRGPGPVNMGTYLLQWFLFCILVSVLCALVALVLPAGADPHRIFHT